MDPELQEQIELRDLTLEFFNDENGKPAGEQKQWSQFMRFNGQKVADMRLACATAGLIAVVSGYGNGANYQTTDDGLILLEALSEYAL